MPEPQLPHNLPHHNLPPAYKKPPQHMLALRPLLRTAPASLNSLRSAFRPSLSQTSYLYRTMASSAAPLQEWLVIIPDFEGALEKRIAVRPHHLEGLKSDREDMWLWGGKYIPVCCDYSTNSPYLCFLFLSLLHFSMCSCHDRGQSRVPSSSRYDI